ncbi:hypothetical protein B0H15DRAFT_982846 [Mycena belliarum]|uniref:DUF6533 domain-containing protein n=1 Tax=Mycena belliarum TaxID=1033014 RepID=A0AAD6XRK4_9AGAR|nr:hypothetical protein B0H15DRAFT_982846 [Mycena belliae]
MSAATEERLFSIFYGLKYFSAVPLVAVVFDHLITLGDEFNTIWKNPNVRWHSKAAFVVNRYLTEAIIAYVVYILSGMATNLSDRHLQVCHRFIWIYGVTCVVAGAISHFVILIRVYGLWDRRASVARVLISAFVACITTTTILGVFSAIEMERKQSILFCASAHLYLWLKATSPCGHSFFDFSLVMLIVFNAMDRPRLTHIEIVSELQNDGAGFFLCIFALRFADLLVAVFREPGEVFIAITTVWAFCTIINARLHMRLEGLSLERSTGTVIMFDDFYGMLNGLQASYGTADASPASPEDRHDRPVHGINGYPGSGVKLA